MITNKNQKVCPISINVLPEDPYELGKNFYWLHTQNDDYFICKTAIINLDKHDFLGDNKNFILVDLDKISSPLGIPVWSNARDIYSSILFKTVMIITTIVDF